MSGGDREGQPVRPTVCIFLMGLELMQGKNQDPAFQKEDTRPEREGGVKAEPPRLSAPKAETIFADDCEVKACIASLTPALDRQGSGLVDGTRYLGRSQWLPQWSQT